jgi:hypothetical protein
VPIVRGRLLVHQMISQITPGPAVVRFRGTRIKGHCVSQMPHSQRPAFPLSFFLPSPSRLVALGKRTLVPRHPFA